MATASRVRAKLVLLLALSVTLVAAKCERKAPYAGLEDQSTIAFQSSDSDSGSRFGSGSGLASASGPAGQSALLDEDGPFPVPLQLVLPAGSLIYQGSVSGTLATIADAENFESGALGPQWSTSSSTPNGLIQVTGAFGTAGGSYALLMDSSISGEFNLNEAIWTVDLSGQSSALLRFSHADFNDEEHLLPLDFVGSAAGDGISISDNGVTWRRVFLAPNVPFDTWEQFEVDLAAAAADAGMTLGADFRIKFQQYDNFPLTTDGRGWDEITLEVSGTDPDAFDLAVDPGQTITVILEAGSTLQATVELFEESVLVGSASAAGPGEDVLIQTIATGGTLGDDSGPRDFEIVATNDAGTFGEYILRVLLDAAAEEESYGGGPNDDLPLAEDLESSFIALRATELTGHAAPNRGAVLGLTDAGSGRALEIEPNDGRDSAQSLEGLRFGVDLDPSIDGSTAMPHVTVQGSGDGTFDYYAFRIEAAGSTGTFDIDFENFDTELFLFDASGLLLATNDDGGPDPGSSSARASFITFSFPAPGTYVIGVAEFNSFVSAGEIAGNPPDSGDMYSLQISLEAAAPAVATPDVYAFDLVAGQSATLALTGEDGHGAGLDLELLDAAGNLLDGDFSEDDDSLVNGSFETASFEGWAVATTGSPFIPWIISGAGDGAGFGMAPTQPQDGSFVAWNGFDGAGPMQFTMFQDLSIPADAPIAELTWQHRIQWNFTIGGFASLPRTLEVQVRDPATNAVLQTLFSFSTGTQDVNPIGDTGWQTTTADLSAFVGQDVRLYFVEDIPQPFTGPGQIEFDAISLAVGQASNVNRLIRNYIAEEDGTFFASVGRLATAGMGDMTVTSTPYSLVITRSSELGLEPNDAIANAQTVESSPTAGGRWVLGEVGDDDRDFYEIQLDAGERVELETSTPADDTGEFVNELDPMLRVYDAGGVLRASDDNSADDGVNALIEFIAPGAGSFFVEVAATDADGGLTEGEYVLSISELGVVVSFSVEAGLLDSNLGGERVRPVDAVDLRTGDLVFSAFPDTILEDIDALHVLPGGEVIFSTSTDVTQGFGGIPNIKNGDLVLWDGSSATLIFSEMVGFGSTHNNVDAFSILPSGSWLLSTSLDGVLGGLTFQNGDIVEYDPVADVATLYLGLDETKVFTGKPNSNPDVDALHVLPDGRLLLSIRSDGIGRVGNGPNYGFADAPRTDLFFYDPATGDGGVFLDGAGLFDGESRNLDAVAAP